MGFKFICVGKQGKFNVRFTDNEPRIYMGSSMQFIHAWNKYSKE